MSIRPSGPPPLADSGGSYIRLAQVTNPQPLSGDTYPMMEVAAILGDDFSLGNDNKTITVARDSLCEISAHFTINPSNSAIAWNALYYIDGADSINDTLATHIYPAGGQAPQEALTVVCELPEGAELQWNVDVSQAAELGLHSFIIRRLGGIAPAP